ncbi:hypothetical protein [Streptosporangium amethystogenes]|uniref:hypothetical protein n=1 Tax=Streptosporangium amethystogenes TaxID=2002 RepID=UPI0012FBB918|nr:hypothetical protein [Streptosporangium amethystogenes]
MGLEYPADYKEFTSRYVSIKIADFLYVRNLGMHSSSQERDYVLDAVGWLHEFNQRGHIDILDNAGNEARVPAFQIYPEPFGLYPWGTTDNGDMCFWLTRPGSQNWTVVIKGNGLWWHHPGSLTDFLIKLASNTLACPLFPDNLELDSLPLFIESD